MDTNELDKIFKISEVAAWMRCSRATIYRLLKSGDLKSMKIGGSRVVTYSQMKSFIDLRQGAE